MRNLKKILALALVFAMAFTFTAGAASFTDAADIGANYVDDVNMLVELGVLAGYPDGSFGPAKNITRAEFAKMAYTLKYGSDADGDLFAAQASKFTDVQGNANVAWAKGYINYCANQNIVSGVGNNKFNPQGNITVAEAAKMILVILGCDPAKEGFTGANWMSNVVAKAIDLGVFNGWAGDPSALATRELVAKLMRNAIFSPIYTYSAITGTGSQVNALGTAFNKTLGETTMGLYHISGIVVANEKNAIVTDEKGLALLDDMGARGNVVASATNDEEMSKIYYTVTESGNTTGKILDIDRGLSDELLGCKVDVYFKAEVKRDTTTGEIENYYNPEVIGNVLVNSDTVVYNVQASEMEILPKADTQSQVEIRPYITFADAEGEEVKITLPSSIGKRQKRANVKNDDPVVDYLNRFAYDTNSTIANGTSYAKVGTFVAATGSEWTGDSDSAYENTFLNGYAVQSNYGTDNRVFAANMGTASLAQYRFVSVDGGKTYSYIFKTDASAFAEGYVTAYNESKGTITVSATGVGNRDFDEVTLKGDIAVDDMVVCYYEDGKIAVEKVEPFVGAVELFNDDAASVVIDGKTYFANGTWSANKAPQSATLSAYLMDRPEAVKASTYYAYNNVVLRLDTDAQAVVASNYAVLLDAQNVTGLGVYVTLGFADGTTNKFMVAEDKLYKAKDSSSSITETALDVTNVTFGGLVKYKLLDNGTVDLSAQHFATAAQSGDTLRGDDVYNKYMSQAATGIVDGAVKYSKNGGTANAYPETDASVVFVLYNDTIENKTKFVVYKLSDVETLTLGGASTADIIFDDVQSAAPSVAVAAMTVAASQVNNKMQLTGISVDADTAKFALVVNAKQKYNFDTEKYYAEFTLINDEGLFTATTVEDVKTFDNQYALDDTNRMNNISVGTYGASGIYKAGTIVFYEMNSEGLIERIETNATDPTRDTDIGIASYVQGTSANGFFLVNVVNQGSDRLSFYDSVAGTPPATTAISGLNVEGAKYDPKGYKVVTISNDEYVGSSVVTKPANEANVKDNGGNAIIHLNSDGEIDYIFSFVDGYIG